MRPMRKTNRILPEEEITALLVRGEYGVMASVDDEGTPLATPLSYVWMDGAAYFHCSKVGHKLDNIAQNPRVCFSVVDSVAPLFENNDMTTRYESAIIHGTAALVTDDDEKRRALVALSMKYFPQLADTIPACAEGGLAVTAVVRITPQALRGKARRPGN